MNDYNQLGWQLNFRIDDVGNAASNVLDRANVEVVNGNAIDKALYTEKAVRNIQTAIQKRNKDIDDNTTLVEYAAKIDAIKDPLFVPVTDHILDKINGEEIEGHIEKAEAALASKNAIRDKLKSKNVDVPDEMTFSDYAEALDDPYMETWKKPDDWPDIVKILDEDEDANRVIADGGGACILLFSNIINASMWYDKSKISCYKTCESNDLIYPASNMSIENIHNLIYTKNRNYSYIILYFSNTEFGDGWGTPSKHIWLYVKSLKNIIFSSPYLQHISMSPTTYFPVQPSLASDFYSEYQLNMRCIHIMPPEGIVSLSTFFDRCALVKEIVLMRTLYSGQHNYTLRGTASLERIIGVIDITNGIQQTNGGLPTNSSMKEMWLKGLKESYNIANMIFLEKRCIIYLIENILNVTSNTKTLTLGPINLAKLTDAEKKIATDKGWILA